MIAMLTTVMAVLFIAAGITAITVLAASYTRAFAAYGELRTALATCDDSVVVTLRIIDHARSIADAAARLRLVSSQAHPAIAPQPAGLRAAA